MGVTRDTGHSFETEVEWLTVEASLCEHGNDERSETAVNVERNLLLDSKLAQCGDVVDNAVREVGCRTHQENGVWVD